MKFTVSHAGKQHSYHLAKALLDLDLLQGFYTSSYVGPAWLQAVIKKSGNTFFSRRFKEGLCNPYTHSHWQFEIKEFLLRKWQGKSNAVQNLVYARDEAFDAMMAKKLRFLDSTHFWGFQGSCRASLDAARQSGKVAVCELATAHVVQARKILGEESRLQPEWADSIDNLIFPPAYEKRLEEEPQVADKVVAASSFTRWTLLQSGIPEHKIHVLPLGFESDKIAYGEPAKPLDNRPLRLLYAGTITQRKGISYLLEAMKSFGKQSDIELHLVGGIQGSGKALKEFEPYFHYHSPVSQYELFDLYRSFDALVLPTIFEGFGLVIVEAMAAGLPVIATEHSMAPEAIENDKNGWIIPIRQVQPIVEAIGKLRSMNQDQYLAMRRAARKKAEGFTWEAYTQNLKLLTDSWK